VIIGLVTCAALILVARTALIFDFIPQFHRDFHRAKGKMLALKTIAGNDPVCFMNSYQDPSLYMFYAGGKAHSINNSAGGKNQYDYWRYNEYIDHKPFLFVASYNADGFAPVDLNGYHFNLKRFSDLPVLHHLSIWTDEWYHELSAGDTAVISANVINNNSYPVDFNDPAHSIRWLAMFNHKKEGEANVPIMIDGLPGHIMPGSRIPVKVRFVVPDRPGKNYMYFAASIDGLPNTYQSNRLRIMINAPD